MRKFAYEHGKALISRMKEFSSLYYALDLNDPSCSPTELTHDAVTPVEDPAASVLPHDAVFVAPTAPVGGDGSLEAPLTSIQTAMDKACSRSPNATVVLRGGTHYISDTLLLGSQHSGLTVMAYPGESPVVSGGVEIQVDWKPFKVTTGQDAKNIWVSDVKGQVSAMPGLQIDGVRATKARYPNQPGGIETSCGYGCMVNSGQGEWTPPQFNKFGKVQYYEDEVPEHTRNDTHWGFEHYMIGREGLCSVYDPPVSYWCSEHTSGGGAFAFRRKLWPIGIDFRSGVPSWVV
jgi:hypothetical protein